MRHAEVVDHAYTVFLLSENAFPACITRKVCGDDDGEVSSNRSSRQRLTHVIMKIVSDAGLPIFKITHSSPRRLRWVTNAGPANLSPTVSTFRTAREIDDDKRAR